MSPQGKLVTTPDVEALIEEVKKRECLWNTKSYPDKDRQKSWNEISSILNVKVGIAKMKWKHLRDIFRRELKKHKYEDPQIYKGKWRFYEQMWFIQGLFKSGKRRSVEPDNDLEENVVEVEESDDNVAFMKVEPYEENEEAVNAIYFEENDDDFDGVLAKKAKKTEDLDDDYDMMYLKSLLPFFKTLDPMRKLVVRTRIQDMLLSEITAAQKGNKS